MLKKYQQVKMSSNDSESVVALFKKFKLITILNLCNIRKSKGKPIYDMLYLFLIFILENSNSINRGMTTNKCTSMKTPVNDMLNNIYYNWRNFLYRIAKLFVSFTFNAKTDSGTLIIDDSKKSKTGRKVQHLSLFFDHCSKSYFHGFQNITCAWSNGRSTIPIDFEIKIGKKKTKQATKSNYAKKSHAEQRVRFAKQKKIDITIQMIKRAFQRNFPIKYILWDSWYNCSDSIKYVAELVEKKGTHLISMLKKGKTRYKYNGGYYTQKELYQKAGKWKNDINSEIKSKSIIVEYLDASSSKVFAKREIVIPIKISFYKYPGVKQWKAILSTNTELSEQEILKLYLQRWSIECLFKEIKQYFGYDQSKSSNYIAMVADLTIRYSFYIMFCYKRELENQKPILQILTEFYEELFDEWLSSYIEKILTSSIKRFVEYAIKMGYTDLSELHKEIDKVLYNFFDKEFYPDKIVDVDKREKRKIA